MADKVELTALLQQVFETNQISIQAAPIETLQTHLEELIFEQSLKMLWLGQSCSPILRAMKGLSDGIYAKGKGPKIAAICIVKQLSEKHLVKDFQHCQRCSILWISMKRPESSFHPHGIRLITINEKTQDPEQDLLFVMLQIVMPYVEMVTDGESLILSIETDSIRPQSITPKKFEVSEYFTNTSDNNLIFPTILSELSRVYLGNIFLALISETPISWNTVVSFAESLKRRMFSILMI
jgi:hypothetical protein